MNAKSMLIAAAVLATPACAVTEDEMTSASDDAVSARVSLLGETFLSRDTFTVKQSRRRPDGEFVTDEIVVRYRLRFIPAGKPDLDYSYEGSGAMEYETVIDQVEEGKPELAFSEDRYYYAKRSNHDTFRIFDCDSTRRCADGNDVSKLRTWTANGKKSVAISGLNQGDFDRPGLYLEGVDTGEVIFDFTAPPPEYTSLPAPVTCTANGHTLTIEPYVPATAHRAEISLRNDATGTVIHADDFSVVKDSLGRHFVIGAWDGLRITLGDRAARYENEVTGKTFDFASGTCR